MLACRKGHVPILDLLLEHGAQTDVRSNVSHALHLSALSQFILRFSSFSKSGWTPLMRASLDGRTVAVESLLHRDDRVHLQEDVSAEYLIACL